MEPHAKVAVLYCFARSGGTLINRCLGSIPGNLVLSEVNPHASVAPIAKQSEEWLGLVSSEQALILSHRDYGDQIYSLAIAAQEQNKHLIIRDWTTVNFLSGITQGNSLEPSSVLEQALYLSKYRINQNSIVITRRAEDVYESLTRTFNTFSTLTVEEFGIEYLNYARTVSQYPIFHYEEFCCNPQSLLEQICQVLSVNYDPTFIHNFNQFTNCTGDNRLTHPSRGSKLDKIAPLTSNQASEQYQAARLNQSCQEANQILGYRYE